MKRIGRIASGEIVLVQVLAEDLQDKFEAWKEAQEDDNRATEASKENPDDKTLGKAMWLADYNDKKAYTDFWHEVRERYDLWTMNLGIRDGYAIVSCPNIPKAVKETFKKMRKELLDDEDQVWGQD